MKLVQNPSYLSFYSSGNYLTFLYNPPIYGNSRLDWLLGDHSFDTKKLTNYPFEEILDLR